MKVLLIVVLMLMAPFGTTVVAHDVGTSRSVETIYEVRTRNVVLQEWDLSCAAAALATILRYQQGEPLTERQVALGLIDRPEYYANPELIRKRQGFSLLDMKRLVQRLGYRGIGLGSMHLGDLVQRAPAIVPVDLHGYPHFVVFRGALGNRVLLANPAFGNMTIRRDQFEAAWIDYDDVGRVAFLVGKNGQQWRQGALEPTRREFVTLR